MIILHHLLLSVGYWILKTYDKRTGQNINKIENEHY